MAFVATATAVGFGSAVLGTAIIGAGVGGLYSAITKDGDVLNSMLTGGLIGAGVGAMLPAAPALSAVPTAAGGASPALVAAQGATAATTPAQLNAIAAAQGVAAEGAMGLPGLNLAAAPEVITPEIMKGTGAVEAAGMTGKQKLAAGLAGTAALSYLGGRNQPTLKEQESESYIRPYTYSQKINPNYGLPGESYFTQSYEAQEPYKAAQGGIMRMATGGAAQPIVPMQQLAAPVSTYGPAAGSNEAQVAGMYRNILGRASDAGGAQYHENRMAQGRDANAVRGDFLNSPENQAREAQRAQVSAYNQLLAQRAQNEYNVQPAPLSTLPGGGERAGAADTQKIINQFYLSNLGRQGDQPGLDYFTNRKMTTGESLADIQNLIKTSPEAIARQQSQAAAKQQQAQSALDADPQYIKYMSAPITAENFDEADYIARNPDAFQDAPGRPYQHYLEANRTGDVRTARKLPFQQKSTPPSQTGYTYNPVTKQFTAPAPAAAQADTAQDSSGIFSGMDPNVLQQMYKDYVQRQQSSGGGAAGGLMPNSLRYANGGEAIDSEKERMQMMNLITNRIQESSQGRMSDLINNQDPSQMRDPRNQLEFMMRNNPNFAASMSPPLQSVTEGAQYGDRMIKSFGGQPKDFNVMQTSIDPSTRSYGGIASIGKQIDPQTRINAMANLYRTPYDKNATDAVRRLGGGISRQIGKDANLSAFYEQDPMGRDKQGGVRFSQNFNQGGDIQGYNLGGYSDGGRLLRGPGDGVSDDIPATIGNRQPARLADGEFVIPARIVSELGNGSTDAGAKRLYAMMDRIQAGRKKTVGKGNVAKDTKAKKHLLA